ncbi:MAG: HAMP domain-containing protein [Treponema sp.]|jgi:adenylate cyclase|nr:HAMP domain-containing protein [Treponema sp.]
MSKEQIKTRVLFPIGTKLVIIISVLLLFSLGAVIALVSFLSTQDVRRTAEYNNYTINQRAGSHAEDFFNSLKAAVNLYLNVLDNFSLKSGTKMENDFFNSNQNIAAIEYKNTFIPNENFLLSNNISDESVKEYFNSQVFLDAPLTDKTVFLNAAPFFRQALLCAVFTRENKTVKALFSPLELSRSFGTGTNTSFIIMDSGDVLLHPDNDLVLNGANLLSLPIVTVIQQSGNSNMQTTFTDDKSQHFFGAYYRLAETGVAVVTTISYDIVFEAVRSITLQNIFLTGVVLFIAIIVIWFFSKTISNPLYLLSASALEIESGDFEFKLQPQTRDEIGLLTKSFGKMTSALNIFGRFTNKSIAVSAMRGEIKPGGLSKHATIFFSDIRGFTEKSEKFTKTFGDSASNHIIKWLNEYFTYMVYCVEKTGGIVDKFIGDAVMAHWGTAYTAGSPRADALNAVKAALMMRNALVKLNEKWKSSNSENPEIHIGCGLNTGIVTAGQIGSEQRMEYTVIGDPVNLASRTEALNKPFGTDILITEDTWNLTGDELIVEEMPSVTVKGKENTVRLFAVVNIKDARGPKTLEDVRNLLGIPNVDISKVDTNAKEKNIRFKAIDIAIVIICLAGSALSGTVFWREYTRTLTKLNEEPVGTVVFTKRIAQRNFINRVAWDIIKKESPVYNGDTIRTIENSEAVIAFTDNAVRLNLYENTILQIFYTKTIGANVKFINGQLTVNSASRNVTITGADSEVKLEGCAQININKTGFSLSVLEGSAVLNGETAETGDIITFDSNGKR